MDTDVVDPAAPRDVPASKQLLPDAPSDDLPTLPRRDQVPASDLLLPADLPSAKPLPTKPQIDVALQRKTYDLRPRPRINEIATYPILHSPLRGEECDAADAVLDCNAATDRDAAMDCDAATDCDAAVTL